MTSLLLRVVPLTILVHYKCQNESKLLSIMVHITIGSFNYLCINLVVICVDP